MLFRLFPALVLFLGLVQSRPTTSAVQRPFAPAAPPDLPDEQIPIVHLPLPLSTAGRFDGLSPYEQLAQRPSHTLRLIHRDFPEGSIRIKRHPRAWEAGRPDDVGPDELDPRSFCDDTVASYTGYIDFIDGRSLFFYFFESRSSPSEDPLLLWITGGPGGASSIGLFMENGPCRAVGEDRSGPPINRTDFFEPSWNSKTNVIYLEQPAGVGYSYVRFGDPVVDSRKAARDVYTFFRIFFAAFEEFRSNDFHIAGESFGGRYVPEMAREMFDRDQEVLAQAKKGGKDPEPGTLINLKSILIGNGAIKESLELPSLYDTMCTSLAGEGPPKLSIAECAAVKPRLGRCKALVEEHCQKNFSVERCITSTEQCLMVPATGVVPGLNPYDMHDPCEPGIENNCYYEFGWIERLLDQDDVRALLGADPRSETGAYSTISREVQVAFHKSGDFYRARDSFHIYGLLLESGIRVLLYAGTADVLCGYLHTLRGAQEIEYSHSIDFEKALTDWHFDGRVVGQTATGGNLSE